MTFLILILPGFIDLSGPRERKTMGRNRMSSFSGIISRGLEGLVHVEPEWDDATRSPRVSRWNLLFGWLGRDSTRKDGGAQMKDEFEENCDQNRIKREVTLPDRPSSSMIDDATSLFCLPSDEGPVRGIWV